MRLGARLVRRGNPRQHTRNWGQKIAAQLFALVFVCVTTLWTSHAFAQSDAVTIEQILVQGNQRVEPATIRTYLTLREGDPFDPARMNRSLQNLFATSLFADVSIVRQGNNLLIRVVENPIVNRIQFEGNNKIKDEDLNKEVQLRARIVYTRTKVQQDVEKILELYRRKGRFAARVEPKIIELPQSRVDVVYEISEGPPTYVRRINFVGNEAMSDGDLRGVILTREERWWRFLSSSDTYDPDRMNYDRELLRRYYLQNGYADFEVISAVAELAPNRENFYMTFTIKEGPRYKLEKVDVDVRVKDLPKPLVEHAIIPEVGDWFNAKKLEDTSDAVIEAAGDAGFTFIDVKPEVKRNVEKRTMAITFHVIDGPRVFIDRINLKGNNVTIDKVIRREMVLVEGDAFNSAKVRRSKQRLENLGFFKQDTTKIDSNPSEVTPDRTNLLVTVEEQPTGELSFGVGYSSASGALFDVGFRQRNLLGKGQDLSANFSIAQRTMQGNISYTEPYFLNRRLSAGVDLVATRQDYQDEAGFTSNQYGATFRLGYQYNEYLYQRFSYQFSATKLTGLAQSVSQAIREQSGQALTSAVSQSIVYDRRNNIIEPTSGYFLSLSTTLAGLGGTERYVNAGAGGAVYVQPIFDWTLSARLSGSYVVGLGKPLKVYQRFQMGGDNLRGFKDFGASPRDSMTLDALGGDWMAIATIELRLPLGLPKEAGLKPRIFNDWGLIGPPKDLVNLGTIGIFDSRKPRGAAGVGVDWQSPVGVISVDYAPFIWGAQPFDQKQVFRINFGNRF